MQKTVSPFSATMIGQHSNSGDKVDLRKDFKQESREVLKYCQGIHHSRKNAHSQSNYPSTVEKLSHFQSNVPIAFKPLPSGIPPQEKPVTQYRVMKESEFMDSMKSNLNNETFINGRKRYYNMQVGRKAVVNEIMNGTAALPGKVLYPQKATHEQILALTGTLKAPNANIVPPPVPRNKKWLGDGIGWES